jgi:hypothetical protein
MANCHVFAGLCRRRGWTDPTYELYQDTTGFTCVALVNGRAYQTDLTYESDSLARENAAMRAFMVCRSFSVHNGLLASNGIVQGLPAMETAARHRRGGKSHKATPQYGPGYSHTSRSGNHSSSSSTASLE